MIFLLNEQGVRDLDKSFVKLSLNEILVGRPTVDEVKQKLKKDKVLVFQPFGRGVEIINEHHGSTGRSFEWADVKRLLKIIEKDYGIIMMSELKWSSKGEGLKNEVVKSYGLGLCRDKCNQAPDSFS